MPEGPSFNPDQLKSGPPTPEQAFPNRIKDEKEAEAMAYAGKQGRENAAFDRQELMDEGDAAAWDSEASKAEDDVQLIYRNPEATHIDGSPLETGKGINYLVNNQHELKRTLRQLEKWKAVVQDGTFNPAEFSAIANSLVEWRQMIQGQELDLGAASYEVAGKLEGLFSDDSRTVGEIKQLAAQYVAELEAVVRPAAEKAAADLDSISATEQSVKDEKARRQAAANRLEDPNQA